MWPSPDQASRSPMYQAVGRLLIHTGGVYDETEGPRLRRATPGAHGTRRTAVTDTQTRLPLVDVVAQNREISTGLRGALEQLCAHGTFVNGPQVAAFEAEYARYARRRWCVGVANGTDALRLALAAAGVGRSDEVILPAQTFVATAEAVLQLGAVPVVVDTDPTFHLLDPARVAERIGPRTRAMVPVHLFGQMAPMAPLGQIADTHGIAIVEDAAQAHGASQAGRHPGQDTIASTTSFYPGKNLGACGDGGAVLTDRDVVAERIRAARDHRVVDAVGDGAFVAGNARLDSLQAVVLSAKLQRLDAWNAARGVVAARYLELLRDAPDVVLPSVLPGNRHVWHLFCILVPPASRDRLVDWMDASGIGCGIHYPCPLHLHPNLGEHRSAPGSCPNAEDTTRRIMSLPMHPHLNGQDQERVVGTLLEGLARG